MEKHVLSKSTFIKGCQCQKALYLNKYNPELRQPISEQLQAIFERGHRVGELAQKLFHEGVNANTVAQFVSQQTVEKTRELIDAGCEVIYEAAFQFEGVLAAMDILVKDNSKWKAYEVKSSTSVSDTYKLDAAVQFYVITNSGIKLEDISIVHLNNEYERIGELDINQLFAIESVIEDVKGMQGFVKNKVSELKSVIESKEIPAIDIGPQCSDPYECDFISHCWKHIPDNSVFNISRLNASRKFELYNQGIIEFKDIPEDYPLNDNQWMQVDSALNNTEHIDKEGLQEFMDTIKYPIYFMDFETFMPALPLFDHSRPYQQIPFQYSLHFQKEPTTKMVDNSRHPDESGQAQAGTSRQRSDEAWTLRQTEENVSPRHIGVKHWLEHYEFLGEAGVDPRIQFIETLLQNTSKKGDIFVYNQAFESTRLKELARDFPDYKNDIEERLSRIKDLMIPFQKKLIYKPQMNGSYSIKAVLPALVPELSYDNLEIHEGGSAMSSYEELIYEKDNDKISQVRNNLLEYCKMDTFAMVKIVEALRKLLN